MFRISQSWDKKPKGLQMVFSNGWTVSVQFGEGNYCQSRTDEHGQTSSETAEIAAWNHKNEWFKFPSDNVKGWCKPEEVARFVHAISTAPKDGQPTFTPDGYDD
jgi:hypothetical protein